MEGTIDKQIRNFVDLIERKYLSTSKEYRPMDLGQKGQFFTLDVISDLAFGEPFGYLKEDDDVFDYIKITDQVGFSSFHLLPESSPYVPTVEAWYKYLFRQKMLR